MADKTINELPKASDIFDTDSFILEQNNVAKKLEGYILRGYAERAAGHVHKGEKGDKGDKGTGITRVELDSGTHQAGTLDTYRIYFSDGTSSTFQVANGADGAAAVFKRTATIPASGWTGDEAPYINEVAVGGLLVTDDPIIGAVLTGDAESDAEISDAYALISLIKTETGKLICYADDVPETDIPIHMDSIRS